MGKEAQLAVSVRAAERPAPKPLLTPVNCLLLRQEGRVGAVGFQLQGVHPTHIPRHYVTTLERLGRNRE